MDILYSGRVDGFCIVSSDSDFTRLATRLREAGMKVFGIGERKTPHAFISACDKFIYIEILKGADENVKRRVPHKRRSRKPQQEETPEPVAEEQTVQQVSRELVKLIRTTISDLADEDGWVFLGDLGNLLLKKQPDFDPRNYGFKKLVSLIESIDNIEVNKESSGKGNISHVYVRIKA